MKKFTKIFLPLMLVAVIAGSIFALAGCNNVSTVAHKLATENPEEYAFAVAHGSTALKAQLDEFLNKPETSELITASTAFHQAVQVDDNFMANPADYDYSNAPITADKIPANAEKTIILVTSPDFAPYEYGLNSGKNQVNGVAGVDVDLMIKFCEEYNYKLTVQKTDFNAIIQTVKEDTNGVMVGAAGLTITDERKENVSFTKPYASTQQALISVKGTEYTSLDQLKGKKVAVQTGSTSEDMIEAYNKDKAEADKIIMMNYKSVLQAYTELTQYGVDAVLVDALVADTLVAKNN